jgi:hypothetical protein
LALGHLEVFGIEVRVVLPSAEPRARHPVPIPSSRVSNHGAHGRSTIQSVAPIAKSPWTRVAPSTGCTSTDDRYSAISASRRTQSGPR